MPNSALKVKSKCFNDVMSPMVDGMVPKIELEPISNFVTLRKSPISDGSDPNSPKLYRSI